MRSPRVDADLATLRDNVVTLDYYAKERHVDGPDCPACSLTEETLAALARVEAELSRLREQRDFWQGTANEMAETEVPNLIKRYQKRIRAAEARCARLQQALQFYAESQFDDNGDIAREALAGPGSEQSSLTESGSAGLPDTPTDDPRCPELNPKSTSEDRCERPAGHSGDHVSVSHSGRVKVYPSKWDTPADSHRCQCPVGSYDRGNAVHADYCPLADSQPEEPT